MDISFQSELSILKQTYENIHRKNIIPTAQPEVLNNSLYCKAIWTIGEWKFTKEMYELYSELELLINEQRENVVLFKPKWMFFDNLTYENVEQTKETTGLLHWTLFQLQTFPVEPSSLSKENIDYVVKYQKDIEESRHLHQILYSFPNFHIEFKGISKTRNGLFLCGFPNTIIKNERGVNLVNSMREIIRDKITDIIEPHPQDICHSTLLRFIEQPSTNTIEKLELLYEKYKDVELCKMIPTEWEYGYGTWMQNHRITISKWNPSPLWILHRGLKNGINVYLENKESELWKRINEGWDIEIDIWYKHHSWWLGHDEPTDKLVNIELLTHPNVWVHCKNLEALLEIPTDSHCFFHNVDDAVLTSKNIIWCFPGIILEKKKEKPSICVLPERVGFKFPDLLNASGVCSDFTPAHFLV